MAHKTVFLLDAYALIFRAYYAFINRPIKNSKGLNTSAIFGFVNTLDEVLRKENPEYLAVVFDPSGPTFRKELYPEYKANRSATPEDIKLAVPYIKEILKAYQIPIFEEEGFEADDVIGTLAKKLANSDLHVYMMTPDKDYAQLVNEYVCMYKPRKSGEEPEIMGPDEVKEKFEISDPKQVIDILALWGDSSDNVPGAPGIGEKTAKKLIQTYGSVEKLLESTSDLKGKQKENLENFADQIRLAKNLVTIRTEIQIDIDLKDLKISTPDFHKLESIFKELEFHTLARRIIGDNLRPQGVQQSLFDTAPVQKTDSQLLKKHSFDAKKVDYKQLNTLDEVVDICHKIEENGKFCFDTETTSLNVFEAQLVGIALSYKAGHGIFVYLHNNPEADKILQHLNNKLFTNGSLLKIGHNLKYDMSVLRNYNIDVCYPLYDTMIAHYIKSPESKHKLDRIVEEVFEYSMMPIEDLIGPKGKGQTTMDKVDKALITNYACEDADFTYRLYEHFLTGSDFTQYADLLEKMEFPLVKVLTDMELAGFKLDADSLLQYEKQLNIEILDTQQTIFEHAGEEFNIASPKQLGIILFDKLKIASNVSMTKTKQYSTSEETLQKLADAHPIVNLILDYRSLTKLQSTYVTALPKLIEPKTGKIHTSFNQAVTATGRLSSINPNLQNIPIRDERGREIRKSFIPSDAQHCIISADYSQIELRLMAHLSEDQHMIEAFHQGADIHQSTAAKVFKVPLDVVTREQRSKAKTANFGIIYGISAFGLSQRLNIPRSESKELIDNYFATFPDVQKYMDACIEQAKTDGYVTTMFGRRRYLPDIHSANSVVRGIAQRNAINSPIQGSAADVIKLAMVHIHQKLKDEKMDTRMILQVHDELIFDTPLAEKDKLFELIRQEMEQVVKLKVPLLVEMGEGNNWLEAH